MTSIGRILTVLVAAGSLAFLGFAGINTFAGPNWEAEKDLLAGDFVFDYTGGENPSWSATRDGQQIKSSPVLAEVVIACKEQLVKEGRERIAKLEEQVQPLEERIAAVEAADAADTVALDNRAKQLLAEIEAVEQATTELIKETVTETDAVIGVRETVAARMKDTFRLRAELDEIRTERFGIEQQKQQLEDLLIRMTAVRDRLLRRQQQLKSDYSESASDVDEPKPGKSDA